MTLPILSPQICRSWSLRVSTKKLTKPKVISLKRVVVVVTKTKEMTCQSLITGVIMLRAKQSFGGMEFTLSRPPFPMCKMNTIIVHLI